MSSEPEPSQGHAITQRAARGAVWAMVGFGGGQALRFAGNIVLTRLLLPESFGLMVLVNTFLSGLTLFTDIGVGVSVIQSKRGDEVSFLHTAWTLSVLRGLAIAVVASLSAWPFAAYYDEPELRWLIPAASLSAMIGAACSMRMLSANRHLQLGRMMTIELVSQAVGLVLSALLALWWRNVWALLVGTALGSLLRTVLSFVAFEPPHERFRWDRDAVKEIVNLGRWIFLSTAITFVSNNLDRFVFGKLASLHALGLYNQAIQLASVPATALSHLTGNIVFPLFAAVLVAGSSLSKTFHRVRKVIVIIGGWAITGLVVGGPALVSVLYPPAYAEAGVMLQILAASSWFGLVLEGTNGAALLALGKTNWVAAGSLAKIVVLVPALLLGHALGVRFVGGEHGGFWGALVGLGASELARYAVSIVGTLRHGLRDLQRDATLTVYVVVTTVAGLWIGSVLSTHVYQGWSDALQAKLALENGARIRGVFDGFTAAFVVTALWAPMLRSAWRDRNLRAGAPAPPVTTSAGSAP